VGFNHYQACIKVAFLVVWSLQLLSIYVKINCLKPKKSSRLSCPRRILLYWRYVQESGYAFVDKCVWFYNCLWSLVLHCAAYNL